MTLGMCQDGDRIGHRFICVFVCITISIAFIVYVA